jgi:hypothetical protein
MAERSRLRVSDAAAWLHRIFRRCDAECGLQTSLLPAAICYAGCFLLLSAAHFPFGFALHVQPRSTWNFFAWPPRFFSLSRFGLAKLRRCRKAGLAKRLQRSFSAEPAWPPSRDHEFRKVCDSPGLLQPFDSFAADVVAHGGCVTQSCRSENKYGTACLPAVLSMPNLAPREDLPVCQLDAKA